MTTFPIHRDEDPAAFAEALNSLRPGDTVSIAISSAYTARAKPATVTGEVWQGAWGRRIVGHAALDSNPLVQSILSIEKPALTEAELDALPAGSFVIDVDSDVWVKHPSGRWATEDGGSIRPAELATYAPRPYAPTEENLT